MPGGGGRLSLSSFEDEVAPAWEAILVRVFSLMKPGKPLQAAAEPITVKNVS